MYEGLYVDSINHVAYGTTTSDQAKLRLNGITNPEDAERLKKIADKQKKELVGADGEEANTPDEINKQIDKEEKKQSRNKGGKINSARVPQVREIGGETSASFKAKGKEKEKYNISLEKSKTHKQAVNKSGQLSEDQSEKQGKNL